jgi:hypothetical protein
MVKVKELPMLLAWARHPHKTSVMLARATLTGDNTMVVDVGKGKDKRPNGVDTRCFCWITKRQRAMEKDTAMTCMAMTVLGQTTMPTLHVIITATTTRQGYSIGGKSYSSSSRTYY